MSVPEIESNGFKGTFSNSRVEIYRNDQLVMLGRANSNLYSIEMEVEQPSCYNSTGDIDSKSQLWHRRFGHLGMKNINILVTKNSVKCIRDFKINEVDTLCEPCLLGKMTKQPFNKSGYRAKKPLELVHTDVCEPITPISRDGHKYFPTFIDDHTHFVMVYLISEKSEIFEKFRDYYFNATNHFNTN